MAVVTIEAGAPCATLINTFTTTPENQQHILDILLEATEKHIAQLPGFICANFHKTSDGTRIVNYAQWKTKQDHLNMLSDPVAARHISELRQLAAVDAHIYEVVRTFAAT